jgi:hypothetical protein
VSLTGATPSTSLISNGRVVSTSVDPRDVLSLSKVVASSPLITKYAQQNLAPNPTAPPIDTASQAADNGVPPPTLPDTYEASPVNPVEDPELYTDVTTYGPNGEEYTTTSSGTTSFFGEPTVEPQPVYPNNDPEISETETGTTTFYGKSIPEPDPVDTAEDPELQYSTTTYGPNGETITETQSGTTTQFPPGEIVEEANPVDPNNDPEVTEYDTGTTTYFGEPTAEADPVDPNNDPEVTEYDTGTTTYYGEPTAEPDPVDPNNDPEAQDTGTTTYYGSDSDIAEDPNDPNASEMMAGLNDAQFQQARSDQSGQDALNSDSEIESAKNDSFDE